MPLVRFVEPALHRDPFRAPTSRGTAPNIISAAHPLVKSNHGYEFREGLPQPKNPLETLGEAKASATSMFDMVVVAVVGLGIGAVIVSALRSSGSTERESLPTPQPVGAGPVIVMPAGSATPVVTDATARVSTGPVKRRRRRTTTQARDPVTGHYKQAGSRKRSVTEGA